MNLLTSKASIYRHQKAKPSKGKASEMSNEDDDRSSLFSDGLQRAASVLSSRRSMSRRFRSPHDYVKEESVTEKFKHEAEHLKSKREYQGAADKYSQAIKLDPEDIQLWLGLAACHLHLQKYEEVVSDGQKATQIDPTNARAWGYVAEAYAILEHWIVSFEAYDKALALLKNQEIPDDNLRGKLQLSYSEAKKKAKQRRTIVTSLVASGSTQTKPWSLALPVAERYDGKTADLKKMKNVTSAWVILEAHEEFKKGYELLGLCKDTPLEGGGMGITGNPQTISYLTNGIVRDERCFYMDSESWFMKQLASQAQYEILRENAWDLSRDETWIIREAQRRQETNGWDDARPALSTTVRICVLNAFLSQGNGQYGQAVGLYKRALAVLDWGRKVWGKASRKERGAIFDSTFVRGVRTLYATALVHAYEQTREDKTKPYALRDIINVAQQIQDDCRDRPVKSVLSSGKPARPVFILSYQTYPEGKARMCKAYYFYQLGREMIMNGEDRADANRHLRLSANEYMNALDFFPQDDELYSRCYVSALEALFLAKTPLRETSAHITDLRAAWAAALPIWRGSLFSTTGGTEKIERLFQFQDNALKAVAEKAGAIGDRIVPGRLGDRIL